MDNDSQLKAGKPISLADYRPKPTGGKPPEIGFNWRDFKIAIAIAFGLTQEGQATFAGIGARSVRQRLTRNGEFIEQAADLIRLLRQQEEETLEAREIKCSEIERELERMTGKMVRNVENALDSPDPERRDSMSTWGIEQLRPKKLLIDETKRSLNVNVHATIPEGQFAVLGKLASASVERLERASRLALPVGETSSEVESELAD